MNLSSPFLSAAGNAAKERREQSTDNEREVLARGGLLLGDLLKTTGMTHSNDVIAQYQEVIKLAPDWEKGARLLSVCCESVSVLARSGLGCRL